MYLTLLLSSPRSRQGKGVSWKCGGNLHAAAITKDQDSTQVSTNSSTQALNPTMNTWMLSWNFGGWEVQLGRWETLLSEGFSAFYLFIKWSCLEGLRKASIQSLHRADGEPGAQNKMCPSRLHMEFSAEPWVSSPCAVLVISTWPQDRRGNMLGAAQPAHHPGPKKLANQQERGFMPTNKHHE